MFIAADIGNTNIVICVCEDEKILFSWRLASSTSRTADEFAASLLQGCERFGINRINITGCIICSVVPALTVPLEQGIKLAFGINSIVLAAGIKTGLRIKTDVPAQVGSDRIADAVAAKALFPLPAIVVDIGTAATISVLDKNGDFIGGIIMPGPRVWLTSLKHGTSQLPETALEPPADIIGKSTADCLKSGAVFGMAAALDGLCARIMRRLKSKSVSLVATGGNAKAVIPYCEKRFSLDENLLIKGLIQIYQLNREAFYGKN